ncbi:MAG: aminotransferase class I/II-fold pyridoxal phosphate-dependent enzyme [Anaerolineales bacterium]|nr:aminotransferase class I/II-fold pyridoxal phosphate-dependent enzyme [Anaerolineales bacterium]
MPSPRTSPAERVSRLPEYFFHSLNQRIATLKAQGRDVIRLDAGSPDLPPAPHIVAALARSAEQPGHHGYMPYNGTPEYRQAWVEWYGKRFGVELEPHEAALSIGAKEGVFNLSLAFLNPGDVALVPDPGYAAYSMGARFAGGEVVHMPLLQENQYLPDLAALPEEALRRARLMWLNYPNNPTGAVATLEFFAQAVALAKRYNFIIAHDAPYTEITYDGYRAPSLLQVPGAKDVAVEFHSMSKTYNMGGWRLGITVGNAEVVQSLSTLQSNAHSGQFKAVQDAAVAALSGDQTWLEARNAHYRRRRDVVVNALRAAGLQAETPAAAIYVWARLPEGGDDVQFTNELLAKTGVSLTPGSIFGPSGAGYIRVSLCMDDARLVEAMARIRG